MITLPKRRPMLPKECKDCGVPVNKENGIMVKGYLVRHCKECRKKKIDVWNKKRALAKKLNRRF